MKIDKEWLPVVGVVIVTAGLVLTYFIFLR